MNENLFDEIIECVKKLEKEYPNNLVRFTVFSDCTGYFCYYDKIDGETIPIREFDSFSEMVSVMAEIVNSEDMNKM
jgi:hypothetical protein